jgi:hypothetical protein
MYIAHPYSRMNETCMDVLFHLERIMFIASYKVDGKLIFLKLTGEGPFNVTGGTYDSFKVTIKR